jgi:hypothetical protein
VNTNSRRTLGAGTEFAKAQSWCFVINMAHKEVSGAIDLKVIAGGAGGEGTDESRHSLPSSDDVPRLRVRDLVPDQPIIINDFSMLSAMSPLYYKGNRSS